MTPYIVACGDIAPHYVALFQEMRAIVERMDDMDIGEHGLSCHLVCHALARHFPAEAVDGLFGVGFQHSWLVLHQYTSPTNRGAVQVIADMYPVAGAAPFLVASHDWSPWSSLYRADRSSVERVVGAEDFPIQVAAVAAHIGQLLSSL